MVLLREPKGWMYIAIVQFSVESVFAAFVFIKTPSELVLHNAVALRQGMPSRTPVWVNLPASVSLVLGL